MNLDNEEKNDTVEEYSNTKHQDSKKKEIFNLHSLLNLKKYEVYKYLNMIFFFFFI